MKLAENQQQLLAAVAAVNPNIVVLLSAGAPVETPWAGQCRALVYGALGGQAGAGAAADILTGKLCPCGKLSQTWAQAHDDTPAKANFGGEGRNVEYREGLYVGYRYYQTAGVPVAFPFGYGLSYTTFEYSDLKADEKGVTLTVTNTGSVAGKDAVQVYFNPPYTDGGIEKASANLVTFGKTDSIEPGASQTLTLTFNTEDMASFDSKDKGCYVLEKGDYVISINADSHTVLDSKVYNVASDIVYDASNKRESDVEVADNKFDFAEGNVTYLSRADGFANYAEATAAPADFELPAEAKATFYNNSNWNPEDFNNADDVAPTTGAKNGLKLKDMVGVDYNDAQWDAFLDQLTVSDMDSLIALGGYQSVAVDSIGKVQAVDCDGPASINNNFTKQGSIGFPSAVMIAATWNTDLAHDFGTSIGKMADDMDVSGWYAPAMNIHRSAFAGRNFEYYSEDGVLSGAMAANAIMGSQEQGVYAFMKHFALNDQETNRCGMLCTWSNEQAIREIYLKPFEISVKDADCHAVMSSFNYIGTRWTGGCKELLKNVLRGEWGFVGFVETDYFGVSGYMTADQCVRNGNDLMLCTTGNDFNTVTVLTNSGKQALRESAKNILYTVVNSRAYAEENLNPGMAKWQIVLIGADVLVALLFVTLEVKTLKGYKKRKEEEVNA